ncbi:MAG: S-layer homology domain-containing protein [Erysipelotrichaceae bacterium]|nr:S-layer homology domain-containing protein [Erysipelotrichaceae bacterium]
MKIEKLLRRLVLIIISVFMTFTVVPVVAAEENEEIISSEESQEISEQSVIQEDEGEIDPAYPADLIDFNVSPSEINLVYGEEEQVVISPNPADAAYKAVFSSTDESVITVSQDGIVKAAGVGTAAIVVKVNNMEKEIPVRVLFTDVAAASQYFYESVYWAVDNNITVGHGGAGKFSPSVSCTREQIVTFLWRLMGEPEPETESDFSDVAKDAWYYKPVTWAYEKFITTGLNDGTGRFGVGQSCSRAMCVTFLYRAAGEPDVETHEVFTDVEEGNYYYDSVSWAASHGITVGLNNGTGRFGVWQDCTRAMIVTFLYRYAQAGITPIQRQYYRVKFVIDGVDYSIPDQIIRRGDKATRPDLPFYIEYRPIRWYTDPDFNNRYNFDNRVLSDLILYGEIQRDEYADATKYSYEVYPIFDSYNRFVYVKTDNPDPESFVLNDKDSRYYNANLVSGGVAQSVYAIYDSDEEMPLFADVVYENKQTRRVKGGYIFSIPECSPDGGELVLQQRVADFTHTYVDYEDCFVDTDIRIQCPHLKDTADILIEKYTDQSKSLFDNLYTVQNFLNSNSVYPLSVNDLSKPNPKRPYPFLTSPWYREHSLNEWYSEMYEEGSLLLEMAYPYLLSSLGFPGVMEEVAKKLEPDCVVEDGPTHDIIFVTFNDKSDWFGGSGRGSENNIVYLQNADKYFRFDGSEDDLYKTGTMEIYRDQLLKYGEESSAQAEEYKDLIAGETFKNTIDSTGGTWIRVGQEGWDFDEGRAFAYVLPKSFGCKALKDAWVDGRYIGEHRAIEYGASFSSHPTSTIVITDFTYTDAKGIERTEAVPFYYNEDENKWFMSGARDQYGSYANIPDEYVLTKEEVESLHVDSRSDLVPETCLIYDGEEYPGTSSLDIPHILEQAAGPSKAAIYNDGSCGYDLEVLDYEYATVHEGFIWSVDRTDGIVFSRDGYFIATPDASGTYVFTCQPAEGATNVTGQVSVRFNAD